MTSGNNWATILIALLAAAGCAKAQSLAGDYVAEPGMTMTLSEGPSGIVTGTLSESGASLPVKGKRGGNGFAGTIGAATEAMPFTAAADGKQLALRIGAGDDAEQIVFTRAEAAATHPAAGVADTARRKVVI